MTTRSKREKNSAVDVAVDVVTETQVRDIADEMLRKAFRDQARDLEKHLKDIHTRLTKLEK
jgi:hypothetical protein